MVEEEVNDRIGGIAFLDVEEEANGINVFLNVEKEPDVRCFILNLEVATDDIDIIFLDVE